VGRVTAVLRGDALRLPLRDGTVDLVVTSPPYFGLRSYTDGGEHYGGQVGSEPTPAEYVDALIAATAEMVRVLKPSGSIFVNLGDKYAGAPSGPRSGMPDGATRKAESVIFQKRVPRSLSTHNKSLMGIPWRYALRCIDDLGLILRAEIIWSKPNGLPESVTDRVRRSHEQWFHLVKQPRYYSAVDEIREAHGRSNPSAGGANAGPNAGLKHSSAVLGDASHLGAALPNPLGKLPGSVWTIPTQPLTVPPHLGVEHFAAFPFEWPRRIIRGWSPAGVCVECGEGRRPVSVSTITGDRGGRQFNPSSGNIGVLGRERSTVITGYVCACTPYTDHPDRRGESWLPGNASRSATADEWARRGQQPTKPQDRADPREYDFDGWTPAPTTPGVVLDPFGGTGTTALIASVLGRVGVSVDMSADYCRLAAWRTTDPGQRATAMQVDRPAPVADGQGDLFAVAP